MTRTLGIVYLRVTAQMWLCVQGTNGTGKLNRKVSGGENVHFTGGEGRRPESQTSKQNFPVTNVQPIRLQARAFLCDPADIDNTLFTELTLGFVWFAFLYIYF